MAKTTKTVTVVANTLNAIVNQLREQNEKIRADRASGYESAG